MQISLVNNIFSNNNNYNSGDEYNVFVPKDVAQISPYLKKIIRQKISEDKTIAETLETITIELKEIKGEILEIVMDYLNHKVNYN